jgi:hypothetical protein
MMEKNILQRMDGLDNEIIIGEYSYLLQSTNFRQNNKDRLGLSLKVFSLDASLLVTHNLIE